VDGVAPTAELALVGARFFLGFLLIASALPKLADRKGFTQALAQYKVVPPSLVKLCARGVPLAEIALGSSLVFGVAITVTATVAAVVFAVFAVAVVINVVLGERVDCGCGIGSGSRPVSWSLVAEDIVLCTIAACVASMSDSALALWPIGRQSSVISSADALAMAIAAGAVLLGALLLGQLRVWGPPRRSPSALR
jgi:Methylamine utilisation protein MauE